LQLSPSEEWLRGVDTQSALRNDKGKFAAQGEG
jgi:hypothetical protein